MALTARERARRFVAMWAALGGEKYNGEQSEAEADHDMSQCLECLLTKEFEECVSNLPANTQ